MQFPYYYKTVRIVDIDGTVLSKGEGSNLDEHPEVLPGAVEKVNGWFEQGDLVVFMTARPEFLEPLTRRQLDWAGFRYNHLILGVKPYSHDIHIYDDRPIYVHRVIQNQGVGMCSDTPEENPKITTLPVLAKELAEPWNQSKTLVLTNGAFDILHVGHIRCLQAASELGDILVVAVNTDESVRRLKGEGRPVVPLQERMEILAAFEGVDYVIPFGEDDPRQVIRTLRPDIHAKGTDYREEEMVEKDEVLKYGGRIEICGDPKDHSVSAMLKSIGCPSESFRASQRPSNDPRYTQVYPDPSEACQRASKCFRKAREILRQGKEISKK